MSLPAQRSTTRTTTTEREHARDNAVERLAAAAARGDRDAFGELYEQFADKLYRFIYVRVDADPATAEDIAAEAWMKALRGMRRYTSRGPGSFAGWLYAIARSQIADHFRRLGRRRERVTPSMVAVDGPGSAIDPANAAEHAEMSANLCREVRRLNPRQREIVTLRFFHGLTVAETARITGRKECAVKTAQHRALAKLAKAIPHQAPDGNQTVAVDVSSARPSEQRADNRVMEGR